MQLGAARRGLAARHHPQPRLLRPHPAPAHLAACSPAPSRADDRDVTATEGNPMKRTRPPPRRTAAGPGPHRLRHRPPRRGDDAATTRRTARSRCASRAWPSRSRPIEATKDIVDAWNADHPDVQVEYVQGSWDSVQDQLVTQFQGGTAPDIIQYESAAMTQFAQQGYLADLTDKLSDETKSAVSDDDLGDRHRRRQGHRRADAAADLRRLRQQGPARAGRRRGARPATPGRGTTSRPRPRPPPRDGVYGVGWGLAEPDGDDDEPGPELRRHVLRAAPATTRRSTVGDAELALPERIHAMTYDDKSLDPVTLTQSGSRRDAGLPQGQVRDDRAGQLHRPDAGRVRARGLRLGRDAAARGRQRRSRRPTRRPCRSRPRARTSRRPRRSSTTTCRPRTSPRSPRATG